MFLFEDFVEKWEDISETADPEYAALLEELMEDVGRVSRTLEEVYVVRTGTITS